MSTRQTAASMLLSRVVNERRVALVHDYLNQYGGAERVLEALHELYPDAPVYTSIYDPAAMPDAYRSWDIRPSWMQRVPYWRRRFRLYFWLYPFVFESLALNDYDLIISSSSAYAKAVHRRADAFHICYCHTPMRFAWRTEEYVAREGIGRTAAAMLKPLMALFRRWDVRTAQGVDLFIANSREVARRVERFYGRSAHVIPPPVDLPAPQAAIPPEDFYLTGGRLVPYKRIDLVVQACTALNVPLIVFGSGRDRAELEQSAGPTVQFVGHVDECALRDLYRRCRAYITAGDEDAGIQPVEAMAAGRPVIAYAAGGALETVIDGLTGRFFHEQTAAALAVAIAQSRLDEWDAKLIVQHAQQYSRQRFKERIAACIMASQGGMMHQSASMEQTSGMLDPQ